MTISLFQTLLYPPPSSLFVNVMSILSCLSLSNGGYMETKGKHMQYSKFFNVVASKKAKVQETMVGSRIGMLLFYTPAFFVGLGSFAIFSDRDLRFTILISVLTIHFLKRVLEVLFVHKYSGSMALEATITISLSYTISTLTMIYAQYLSHEHSKPTIDLKNVGTVLFFVGIVGNFYHHHILSNLRTKDDRGYKIPKGGLFGLVICPHYLFEIIEFIGVSCIAQTTYVFAFSLGTMFYLMGRSYATRQWYISEFGDKFGDGVKALIPMTKSTGSQKSLYWNIYVRYSSSRALVKSPAINDGNSSNFIKSRTRFNKFVRNQCRIGFKSVNDALILFRKMIQMQPLPSLSYFTQIVAAIARMKHYEAAISLIKEMESQEIIDPDVHILSVLINCYCHLNRVDLGFSVLGRILKLGYEIDVALFTTLIKGLIGDNQMGLAVELFKNMVVQGIHPNSITCGTIINGLCKTGNTNAAIELVKKMEKRRMEVGDIIYSMIIDSLCKDGMITEAFTLFKKLIPRSSKPNLGMYNSLIHGLCNTNRLKEGMDLFENISNPDVQTYTILVDTLCKEGEVEKAAKMVDLMIEKRVKPDVVTYSALIDGYCLQGRLHEAEKVLDSMISNECQPNVHTYNILINGYCKKKRTDDALKVFDKMSQRGLIANTITYTTLIHGFCLSHKPSVALNFLKKMQSLGQHPDLVTYSILLDGLFKRNYHKSAMKLFRKMKESKLELDVVVYGILINGLCKARELESAKNVFHGLQRNGIRKNTRVYNILIDGLFKGGLENEAIKLFQEMVESDCCYPDSCTYNVVIQGLVRNNDGERAIEFVHEMVGKGFSVDASTAEILLGLSNDGKLEKSPFVLNHISQLIKPITKGN
ncbi:hypothetical protein LXL04_012783 [Taraxacum kok-saghyz]